MPRGPRSGGGGGGEWGRGTDAARTCGGAGGVEGPVHQVGDRGGPLAGGAVSRQPSAVRGRTREAGSGPPGPARVPARVARHHLTRIGGVGGAPGGGTA